MSEPTQIQSLNDAVTQLAEIKAILALPDTGKLRCDRLLKCLRDGQSEYWDIAAAALEDALTDIHALLAAKLPALWTAAQAEAKL